MTPFIPFTPAHSLSLRCDAKVSTISTPPIYVRSLQLPGDELSNLSKDGWQEVFLKGSGAPLHAWTFGRLGPVSAQELSQGWEARSGMAGCLRSLGLEHNSGSRIQGHSPGHSHVPAPTQGLLLCWSSPDAVLSGYARWSLFTSFFLFPFKNPY